MIRLNFVLLMSAKNKNSKKSYPQYQRILGVADIFFKK